MAAVLYGLRTREPAERPWAGTDRLDDVRDNRSEAADCEQGVRKVLDCL